VEPSNNFINPLIGKNILTLRYNPSLKSTLPKLTWKDFQTHSDPVSINFINQCMENYVQKHNLDSQNKISIALSGGIDSTLALSVIRKMYPNLEINAISIKFADSTDETQIASKIAERLDANHEIISLENYLLELPKAISIIKQPFWDLHWYYVVKQASSSSSHIISGDGGDELFGGYTFRYSKFLSSINRNSSISDKIHAYLECHQRDHVPDQNLLFGKKSNFSWNSIHNILLPYFDNSLDPLTQVFLSDYNGKLLHNFAPINSTIHQYFDMKSITPILNSELIDYSSHLHSNEKYDEITNIGKIPLRKLLEKYEINDLINNQKQGFSVDTLNLWKSYGKKLCKFYLDESRLVQDDWINNEWIVKHIDKNNLDIRYVNKFLGLLAFEIWYRLFITKEMNSDEKLSI
jgi:asparagine synthase (glutamine-hydrolysing)